MAIINFLLTKLKNGVKSVIKSKILAFRYCPYGLDFFLNQRFVFILLQTI